MAIDPRATSDKRIQLPDIDGYPLPFISRKALKRVKNPLPVPVSCHNCGPKTPVFLVPNKEIYGKSYGEWPYAYLCENCESYVGLHKGTDIPLGTLADKETRECRKRDKKTFNVMMKELDLTKDRAYEILAAELDIPVSECHWGWFTADQCRKAGMICSQIVNSTRK